MDFEIRVDFSNKGWSFALGFQVIVTVPMFQGLGFIVHRVQVSQQVLKALLRIKKVPQLRE